MAEPIRKTGYKATVSQDGGYHAKIDADVNETLNSYCRETGINRKTYVNECLRKCLKEDGEKLKRKRYEKHTKEELVEIILQIQERIPGHDTMPALPLLSI